ncbi:interaptin-like isoform X2 [Prorops nasuta]
MRYIEFLEEQREKDERNYNLLGALNKVDNSLVLMAAKTDRLNILRKQYELYLMSAYRNQRLGGSVTGDSGIVSQNEDGSRISKEQSCCFHEPRNFSYQPAAERRIHNPISPHRCESRQSLSSQRMYDSDTNSVKPANYQYLNSNLLNRVQPLRRDLNYRGKNDFYDVQLRVPIQSSSLGIRQSGTFGSLQDDPSLRQAEAQQSNRGCTSFFNHPSTIGNQIDPDNRFASAFVPLESTSEPPRSGLMTTSTNFSRLTMQNPRYYDTTLLTSSDKAPTAFKSRFSTSNWSMRPSYSNYALKYPRDTNSSREPPSLTTREVDEMLKLKEPGLTKSLGSKRTSFKLSEVSKELLPMDESSRLDRLEESDLEIYINRIRNLHTEKDQHSLEEADLEQNTSGDILNVTLSDDEFDNVCEKGKEISKVSDEMAGVLALANDLASGISVQPEQPGKSKRHFIENLQVRNDLPRTAPLDERVEDKISGLIPASGSDLDMSHRNIEEIAKHHWNSEDPVPRVLKRNGNSGGLQDSTTKIRLSDEEISKSIKSRLLLGTESEVEPHIFSIVEELQPWSLQFVERQIRRVPLDSEDVPQPSGEMTENIDRVDSVLTREEYDNTRVTSAAETKNVRNDTEETGKDSQNDESNNLKTIDGRNEVEIYKGNDDGSNIVTNEERVNQIASDEIMEYAKQSNVVEEQLSYEQQNEAVTGENQQGYSEGDQPRQEYAENFSNQYEHDPNQEYTFDQQVEQNQQYELSEQQYQHDNQQYPQDDQQYQQVPYQHGDQQYQQQNEQFQPNQAEYDQLNQTYQQDVQQYQQDGQQYLQYQQEYDQQTSEYQNNQQYQQDQQGNQEYQNSQQFQQEIQEYQNNQQYQQDQQGDQEYQNNQQYQQDQLGIQEYQSNQQYQQDQQGNQEYQNNQQYEQSLDQYGQPEQFQKYDDQYHQYGQELNPEDNRQYITNQDSSQNEFYAQNENYTYGEQTGKNGQETVNVPETEYSSNANIEENQLKAEEVHKKKDVIKSILDSDTDSTIERNVSNTESDFDFN